MPELGAIEVLLAVAHAGSFNAAVAEHLFAGGLAQTRYVAAQGQATGADGRVHCSIDGDGGVWIAGRTVTIARDAALNPEMTES